MSVYDEKLMQDEVTDKEFEEAKDFLPYRELCGVLSYPVSGILHKTRIALLCFCLWKAQAKVGCKAISSDDEGV